MGGWSFICLRIIPKYTMYPRSAFEASCDFKYLLVCNATLPALHDNILFARRSRDFRRHLLCSALRRGLGNCRTRRLKVSACRYKPRPDFFFLYVSWASRLSKPFRSRCIPAEFVVRVFGCRVAGRIHALICDLAFFHLGGRHAQVHAAVQVSDTALEFPMRSLT